MVTDATEETFGSLLKAARRSRPAGVPTLIVVSDNFHKFHGSSLWKASVRTKAFEAINLDDATDEQIAGAAGFLRWSPWSVSGITDEQRARIPAGARIINDTDFSCSKTNVMSVFERVFGRKIRLDPLSDSVPAVEKSDYNGWHDGRIVELPITGPGYVPRPPDDPHKSTIPDAYREPNFIYQRVIDNTFEGYAYDIRVPYYLGSIRYAYVKIRPIKTRFVNRNVFVKLVAPYEVLSPDELAKCKQFFEEISLEYGEIDVLRDAASREVYIVDANNTPAGPPRGLSDTERALAFRHLGAAVQDHFFG